MKDLKKEIQSKQFLIAVYLECSVGKKSVRDIINESGFPFHHKRAWFLLEKWCGKGWYEYGVTLDLGWLTEEGIEKAKSLSNELSVN